VPLSAADKRALVAFLKTLTDESYRAQNAGEEKNLAASRSLKVNSDRVTP
jgi:hypothetical protein